MRNFFITGDLHGKSNRIYSFCARHKTTKNDVLIVLGDAGFNYWLDRRDLAFKYVVSKLPVTLFCIHGNHEQRPQMIGSYEIDSFCGGAVYVEPEYPNIIFAIDGQIYDFCGVRCMAIGGAYSVDKPYRIRMGIPWFANEQISLRARLAIERKLKDNTVDVILSHTCPHKYLPFENFIPGVDQSGVDQGMELWMDTIERTYPYKRWYCGHHHIDKRIDDMYFMYKGIDLLCAESERI